MIYKSQAGETGVKEGKQLLGRGCRWSADP